MSELFPKQGESKSYKVSLDVAMSEIEKIEDELGSLDDIQKETFVDAIRRGFLSFDSNDCSLVYVLEKPVGKIKDVKVSELTTEQIQEISKGDVISANKKGEMAWAMKDQKIQRTIRLLNKVCGYDVTDVAKIKKRDLSILIVIADFLG